MHSFTDIMQTVRERPPLSMAVPVPEEEITIAAVAEAARLRLAVPILVGDPGRIRAVAEAAGADVAGLEIIEEPDAANAAAVAVGLVADGRAQLLLKGKVDTSVFMKAVLAAERGLRGGGLLSHVAVVKSARYERLFFVSDGGINIAPTLEQKAAIIRNAVWVAHRLGVEEPKVAILAAVEKVNEKIAATVDAERLTREYTFPGAIVSGPMAPDSAVDADVAIVKGLGDDPVAGRADIFLCPDINSANMMVRAMLYFGDATWGGIVVGARAPIVLTSRADTDPRIRLNSIAVAACIGIREPDTIDVRASA
jgi:phosphate butyryltransferase